MRPPRRPVLVKLGRQDSQFRSIWGKCDGRFWYLGQFGAAERTNFGQLGAAETTNFCPFGAAETADYGPLGGAEMTDFGVFGGTETADFRQFGGADMATLVESPRREVVRSSAGADVVYPPFFGSFM